RDRGARCDDRRPPPGHRRVRLTRSPRPNRERGRDVPRSDAMPLRLVLALALLGAGASACGDAGSSAPAVPPLDPSEAYGGGAVTVERFDGKAFSQSAPALGFGGEANFKSGNLLFRRTPRGIGPLFATQSCQGCHEQDGRGNPPVREDEPLVGSLLRLSVPGPDGRLGPDPIYGDQLQGFGVDVAGPSRGLARHDGALLGDGAIGEAFVSIE